MSFTLKNTFSWSKSRHGKFVECRRLYWFHYYGSWGGWDPGKAPPIVRERYILKNLSSRQQWAGSVVHDFISEALKGIRRGTWTTLDEMMTRARHTMRCQFRDSRAGLYRRSPKRNPGLIEHELNLDIPDEEWRRNWENAAQCLRQFFEAGWPERARTLSRDDWLPVDAIDSFYLDGIKVFAAPDFALREDGKLVLVDWKTGQPREEDHEQVRGYALFAASRWSVPPENIVGRLVYLGAGKEIDVAVDEDALAEFRAHFRESVAAMNACLRDPESNKAHEDDFPMTEHTERCRLCAFGRLCGRASER
ncbi:MAG: PD-(D/E)XK nuclease family protein [Myxococcaceae bacterium]|nr:PD-(D/E)XK nuclease family protein [Myxococcaceae bacterium]